MRQSRFLLGPGRASILHHILICILLTFLAGGVQAQALFGTNLILNGDPSTPSTFQRPLFVGRNTIRAPRTSEFNVRYTRLFPLGERFKLEFIAESTIVLNRTNVVD